MEALLVWIGVFAIFFPAPAAVLLARRLRKSTSHTEGNALESNRVSILPRGLFGAAEGEPAQSAVVNQGPRSEDLEKIGAFDLSVAADRLRFSPAKNRFIGRVGNKPAALALDTSGDGVHTLVSVMFPVPLDLGLSISELSGMSGPNRSPPFDKGFAYSADAVERMRALLGGGVRSALMYAKQAGRIGVSDAGVVVSMPVPTSIGSIELALEGAGALVDAMLAQCDAMSAAAELRAHAAALRAMAVATGGSFRACPVQLRTEIDDVVVSMEMPRRSRGVFGLRFTIRGSATTPWSRASIRAARGSLSRSISGARATAQRGSIVVELDEAPAANDIGPTLRVALGVVRDATSRPIGIGGASPYR